VTRLKSVRRLSRYVMICASCVLLLGLAACKAEPSASPTPSPSPGGTIVRSDSLVSGEITEIKRQQSGYPWQVSVLIHSSDNVDSLPNPTSDKVGQVVTMWTDQDLTSLKVGDLIIANVKLAGDVEHGTRLYIYNIQLR
jgi:hypothetical protein